MYKINICDNSLSLKRIPHRFRYTLLFSRGCQISFTSKRIAFDFVACFSDFSAELLELCHYFTSYLDFHSWRLKPSNGSNADSYIIYSENYSAIKKNYADLELCKKYAIDMDRFIRKIDTILVTLLHNAQILHARKILDNNRLFNIIFKVRERFWQILNKVNVQNYREILSIV